MSNILETNNYEQFKLGTWNRKIKESNLRRLEKAVQENGWKKHPIIVNENMEVIDGQHRLEIAKANGLPVYYVVVDGLNASDCVQMNNTRRAWTLLDFIKYYASEGNENYVRLKEVFDSYDFAPMSLISAIIKGNLGTGSGWVCNMIRNGEYILGEEEIQKIKAKLDYLQELHPYIKEVKGRLCCIYSAIAFCYDNENIDKERLKTQIQKKISAIIPPANMEMAVEAIEWMYNYAYSRRNYVDITAEYKKFAREQQTHGVQACKKWAKSREMEAKQDEQ